ncbi:1,4-beta-xylanase [Mucilaginibacter panaciglaebae]|uniref:Cellulase (Glycosyl hydrolase family 5) n=1 Tax=Mucilaginibacter panaciglaebae TaxID=502331 RepID=A0ABP7WYB8_9SPHI
MKAIKNLVLTGALCVLGAVTVNAQSKSAVKEKIWSAAKANRWYAQHRWIAGANFIPSNAINQLEMWQADTFDPKTIDRELGYAEGIGFNTMRVFLHSVAYTQDPKGFKSRVNQFLTIADKHHIQPIFVFFDDCWNNDPKPGRQPAVKVGVHNSGWMQDPGVPALKNPKEMSILEHYVKDVLTTFAHDKRILLWDLFNEPGNSGKKDSSMPLLVNVFSWAHQVRPDQPVSAGLWDWTFEKLNTYQVLNSDVITYHNYDEEAAHLRVVQLLKTHGKPLICTEYMARPRNSTFGTVMPMLKKEHVGAINWGFVAGKTNTIYAWDTPMPGGEEPKLWFHDIFRKDGTPYKTDEVELIRKLTSEKN